MADFTSAVLTGFTSPCYNLLANPIYALVMRYGIINFNNNLSNVHKQRIIYCKNVYIIYITSYCKTQTRLRAYSTGAQNITQLKPPTSTQSPQALPPPPPPTHLKLQSAAHGHGAERPLYPQDVCAGCVLHSEFWSEDTPVLLDGAHH